MKTLLSKTGFTLGTAILTAGFFSQTLNAQTVKPPASVANLYANTRDANVSDDFSAINPTKWAMRKNKTSGPGSMIKPENNQIKTEGRTKYLSLLANSTSESGISALHPHQDGFTIVRWRIRGITKDKKHSGHPSIWSFSWNFSDNSRQDNNGGYTTEIDWMEYDNSYKLYHSRIIPAYDQVSHIAASAFMFKDRNDFNGWHIQGYENNAQGLQVWDYKNGTWRKAGVPVKYTNEHTEGVGGTITAGYRSPQWFILSNVWFEKDAFEDNPVNLDIDYLHHYKLKGNSNNQPQPQEVTVELEDFTSTGNQGGPGDANEGFYPSNGSISWNTTGDYADYSVNFPETGRWLATIHAASPINGDINARISLNGSIANTVAVPTTGNWANFTEVELGEVRVTTAGSNTIRIQSTGSSKWQWNADKVVLRYLGR